ncbi:hypothetical protein ACFLQZ_04365, partial [Acidobacteriota bacterium]
TNDLFESNMDMFEAARNSYEQFFGFTSTLTGDGPKLNAGIDMFAEVIAFLTDNFGLGLGFGYTQRTAEGDIALTTIVPGFGNVVEGWKAEPKIAVPSLLLSAHYFYPLMEKLNIFFNAGIGLYFGTESWEGSLSYASPLYTEMSTETATFNGTAVGFHGGFGAEFKVNSNISFFVEGRGRAATIKSLKGDRDYLSFDGESSKESGTIWYVDSPFEELNIEMIEYRVQDTKPDDPWLQNVRKWEVKLSGISGVVGIRILFGKKS